MKDKNICKRIQDLCFEQNIDYKDLEEKVCSIIDQEGNKIAYPSQSTVNRWCNAKTTPKKEYLPYIAEAFGVEESELEYGKDKEKEKLLLEVDRISSINNLNEKEKELITRILWLSKYNTFILTTILLCIDLILLNATIWKNALVYLVTIIISFLVLRFDHKKYLKTMEVDKEPSFVLNTKSEFISGLLLHYMIVIVLFAFLPFIELVFYKGPYYLSCTIYSLLALILIIKSLIKK